MSADESQWSPDTDEALKALINATIKSAGPIAPDAIPSVVKNAIRGQATGDLDVDAYIAKAIKELTETK